MRTIVERSFRAHCLRRHRIEMVETSSGESFEHLLRRFKKEVAQDGILRVYREKSRFQTKRMREQTKRKRAARKAQKRRATAV